MHTEDCYVNHPARTGSYTNVHVVEYGDWGYHIQATCSSCGWKDDSYTTGDYQNQIYRIEKMRHTCQAAYTEKICGKNEDTVESVSIVFE